MFKFLILRMTKKIVIYKQAKLIPKAFLNSQFEFAQLISMTKWKSLLQKMNKNHRMKILRIV